MAFLCKRFYTLFKAICEEVRLELDKAENSPFFQNF